MTLWLIIVEAAIKVRAVWILPFTHCQLTCFELAHEFHFGGFENVRALSVLLAIFPHARVDISVDVDHDTLA